MVLVAESSALPDAVRGHPLLLPRPPFPAASLRFSSAPVPPRSASQTVLPPSGPGAQSSRRRRRAVLGISTASYQTCEDIFVNSQFGRWALV